MINDRKLKQVLKSLLLAINASECLEDTSCYEVRNRLLEGLNEFRKMLENYEYATDNSLSIFAKVFNDVGWDGQGFRWKNGHIVCE